MLATEFIREKKLGLPHREESIQGFIKAYVENEVPDYQMAAWLMAVCLKGMSDNEVVALTTAMADSGQRLSWKGSYLACDKHSTGGIGDKTSLIVAPLIASFGIPVPMMAGRGLGFTGGTLDKLESIPGFNTRVPLNHLALQMEKYGFFLVGQTDEICPADKRMYSLRDVTATVESLPLICASILSKKIAEGAQALVMDVKFGSGAFMSSKEEAYALAKALIHIGQIGGLNVTALLSNMNEPLGRFVGNSLEVKECLDIMKGESPKDGFKDYRETRKLSLELSAQMLLLSGYEKDIQTCRRLCEERLTDGTAYRHFEKLCEAQSGRLDQFTVGTKEIGEITADQDGFMKFISNKHIGLSVLILGGGRQKTTDTIDHQVGIEVLKRHGDPVKKGEPLFKIHFNDHARQLLANEQLKKAFEISPSTPATDIFLEEVL